MPCRNDSRRESDPAVYGNKTPIVGTFAVVCARAGAHSAQNTAIMSPISRERYWGFCLLLIASRSLRHLAQAILPPCDQDEIESFRCENVGKRLADAGRRACNEYCSIRCCH